MIIALIIIGVVLLIIGNSFALKKMSIIALIIFCCDLCAVLYCSHESYNYYTLPERITSCENAIIELEKKLNDFPEICEHFSGTSIENDIISYHEYLSRDLDTKRENLITLSNEANTTNIETVRWWLYFNIDFINDPYES